MTIDDAAAAMPAGAWPVLPTPFNADLSIDWAAVDGVVDWYIEQGIAGLFTCSMSSELFYLHQHERDRLAERVVTSAAGRVPVIASAVGAADTASWGDAIRRTQACGVDAVVLITSLLADVSETPWTWQERVERILAAVPDGDLGLYECPVPYKRLLSASQLSWAARTGRFVYFKDTSHDVPEMGLKIDAVSGTRLSVYNAEIQSLVATVRAGGHGFSGLAANIYPRLVSWLCENATSDDIRVADVQRLLSVAEHGIGWNYPTSAKFLLGARFGVPIAARSRMKPQPFTAHQTDPVLDLADYLESQGLLDLPLRGVAASAVA